jgi:hypothetical protein
MTSSFSDSSANSGGTSIAFLSSNTGTNLSGQSCNLTYVYYFGQHPDNVSGHWTIEKAQQESNSPSSNQCGDSLGGTYAPYAPIIDPSIVITAYTIKVNDSTAGNPIQPSVFLYISGYTGNADKTKTYFDIQTTISERI